MIISRQKKESNIIEYLLYMWQIEDIIRAYKFDINLIETNIISSFQLSEVEKKEMYNWYEGIIETMKLEEVTEKGHFQALKNIIFDLNDLHLFLLQSSFHTDYRKVYESTVPYIVEYQLKSNNKDKTIVEICLEAMYGVLLIKLQKKEITIQTEQAVKKIGAMLALIAKKYFKRENDDFNF